MQARLRQLEPLEITLEPNGRNGAQERQCDGEYKGEKIQLPDFYRG